MIAALNKQIKLLLHKLEPQTKLVMAKWQTLQLREQRMVGGLAIFFSLSMLYIMASGLIDYQASLAKSINNLNSFTLYSKQAAATYKAVNSVEANSFNSVNLEQIKGDVTQVLAAKDPDILIQDGQMTLNAPNAEFNQVMALLDQFRRSYAIFPSQVTITRQSRAGYVSFNATFWVKQ